MNRKSHVMSFVVLLAALLFVVAAPQPVSAIEAAFPPWIPDDKDKGPQPNPTGTDPDIGAYEATGGSITVTKETDPDGGMGFTFTLEPNTHPFVTKWGSYGTDNGEFDHPMGMAVDESGNVYVVDHYNHRVQKFDSNGVYLTQWGSFGANNGEFDYPIDVAVDGSGNVYIADYNNSRIQKFDSNGVYLSQWGSYGSGNGELYGPYGVAVDGLGNVYVADTYNNRIQKFDSNGLYLAQWGSYGSGNGEFYYPYGVEVDGSGNIYVADTYNHRVQKLDSNGVYLTQWGGSGSGNGLFSYPAGLALDGFGNVYVTDVNSLIQKFDDGGTFLTQWGGYGSGDGQLAYPYSVDVDEAGYVFVTDTYNHRIQKFGPSTVVLNDDESHTFTGLPAGNYSVSEVNLPSDWSLEKAICDNMATAGEENIAPTEIPVEDGDAWVCTFTNNFDEEGDGLLYIAPNKNKGMVGGVAYNDEDIVVNLLGTSDWAMYFDGSDVGITKNLTDFTFTPDDCLLMTFNGNQNVPGVGVVKPQDLVKFCPTQTGPTTAGTFSLYFDGSDVGLAAGGETIDAVEVLPNGDLVISTKAKFNVGSPALKGQKNDLLLFHATSYGANTAGTWSLFFNNTQVAGLKKENIISLYMDATGDKYVSFWDAYPNIGGVSGNQNDILIFHPDNTVEKFWTGADWGYTGRVHGLHIVPEN